MNSLTKNICQPGHGASCAFCCGSHNFELSKSEKFKLFARRTHETERACEHPDRALYKRISTEGMQCPHIAEIDNNILGCAIYTTPKDDAETNSFFTGTCKNFKCEAWEILDDKAVIFAAQLMKDWYYYSLLINSPQQLLELSAEFSFAENVSDELLEALREELEENCIELM